MKAPIAVALILGALVGAPLPAQQRSPVADLLQRARNALDNLQYSRADSIGRGVLAFGARATRAERIEALQLVAAALYPEEVRSQRRDSALLFLKQLVRLNPDRDLPRVISWPGLDSLLVGVRLATFSAIAHPQHDNALVGSAPTAIPVTATRSARFLLTAVPEGGGAAVVLDSVGPTKVEALRLRLLGDQGPRLKSGRWLLMVRAIDASAPDSLVMTFGALVDAPPLALLPIPAALDSTQLLPEVSKPAPGRAIAIGLGLGGVTALLATVFRAADPVKSAVSTDVRAYAVGAGIAIGAVLGGRMDHGSALPQNVLHNAQLRAALAQKVRDAGVENDRRRAAYHGSITIETDPR